MLKQVNSSNSYCIDQSFQEYSSVQNIKKNKSKQSKRQLQPPEKVGKWTADQNLRYMIFIDHFREKVGLKERRRMNKIFKIMEKFIPSRNSIQCRSHHQKLERRFKNVQVILSKFKQKYGPEQYKEKSVQIIRQFEVLKDWAFSLNGPDDYLEQKEVGCQTDLEGIDKVIFMKQQQKQQKVKIQVQAPKQALYSFPPNVTYFWFPPPMI